MRQIGEGDPSHVFGYPQLVDAESGLYSVLHVNPLGGRTGYTFTDAGHATSIERIDAGEAMTIVWDPALDRPTAATRFDGTVLQLQDWVDDDPTTVFEPSGNVVEITYETDGVGFDAPLSRPIAIVTDSLGPVRGVAYDPAGRLVAIANGEGETTTLDYVGAEVSRATSPWGSILDLIIVGFTLFPCLVLGQPLSWSGLIVPVLVFVVLCLGVRQPPWFGAVESSGDRSGGEVDRSAGLSAAARSARFRVFFWLPFHGVRHWKGRDERCRRSRHHVRCKPRCPDGVSVGSDISDRIRRLRRAPHHHLDDDRLASRAPSVQAGGSPSIRKLQSPHGLERILVGR